MDSQSKGQHDRHLGLKPKFTKGDSIVLFYHSVKEDLQDHGFDTITYLLADADFNIPFLPF